MTDIKEKRGHLARRALVLHDEPAIVALIEQALNHGLFVVRVAMNVAEAEAILSGWCPQLAVVDMDRADSAALLRRLGASNSLQCRSVTPILGLTRCGDVQTKLRAFDLGVDDIVTVPFSPEELLARASVISQGASGTELALVPRV